MHRESLMHTMHNSTTVSTYYLVGLISNEHIRIANNTIFQAKGIQIAISKDVSEIKQWNNTNLLVIYSEILSPNSALQHQFCPTAKYLMGSLEYQRPSGSIIS